MEEDINLPWLAVTKIGLKKISKDLNNKRATKSNNLKPFITNSDIIVLMYILQKTKLNNKFEAPRQKELATTLNLSVHRISVAFSNLTRKGYILRTNEVRTYMINPFIFYIGGANGLHSKRRNWNNLLEKNFDITDELDKLMEKETNKDPFNIFYKDSIK